MNVKYPIRGTKKYLELAEKQGVNLMGRQVFLQILNSSKSLQEAVGLKRKPRKKRKDRTDSPKQYDNFYNKPPKDVNKAFFDAYIEYKRNKRK